MKRMIMLALGLLASVLLVFPAAAQPGWSVYLFNNITQQVLRISLDGAQQTYNLGLPEGVYLGRRSIDFTADGNRAAYCMVVNQPDGALATLIVRDLASGAVLMSVEIGKTDGCWVTYSEDASQIAVGVVRYYAGAPDAPANLPTWQLLVFDAASGGQLHEMNPVKGNASFDAGRTLMPDVRYFTNNQIVFAGIPWGTEGFPLSPAYFWQLSDDSVQPVDRWWRWGLDSLNATGELVWVELDQSLPAADPGGPMVQANVVKLADRSGQEYAIYRDPDWIIMGAQFIDNGRQLAISELEGFDPNRNPGGQATRWMALDRGGTISELATMPGFSELAAAPDGYVLLWASDNSASPLLTLEYRSGRETTTLWQSQETQGITWSLLWASPTPTADGLPAFQAVS